MPKIKSARSQERITTKPFPLEMQVIITNGDPAHDAKFTFQFSPDQTGAARLWLVKLPPLKNPDAFPRELATGHWRLILEAVAETQPLQILHYTPASARQWLKDAFNRPSPAPTELLILCRNSRFTITIQQSLL